MMSRMFTISLIFICILQTLVGCISYPEVENEIRMELPDYDEEDRIIEYTGFTVSYDESARIPRWVAYELTAEEANGTIGRDGKSFRVDDKVDVTQADYSDYRGTGWSRGHMAPAGDFKWDNQAMWDTFYYTNCCPQDEKLNNGSWNVLENRVRMWARQFGSIYIVTGPIINQNNGRKIGHHRVAVPDAFFKAILVKSNEGYQGIAFVMSNNPSPQRVSESYLSINELEMVSGLDLFPLLDDMIEEEVEGNVTLNIWGL